VHNPLRFSHNGLNIPFSPRFSDRLTVIIVNRFWPYRQSITPILDWMNRLMLLGARQLCRVVSFTPTVFDEGEVFQISVWAGNPLESTNQQSFNQANIC
jgi:hypothetical protein